MKALYDVNALLALFVPDHRFSKTVRQWHLENASKGWATCPLTQNGLLRVASQPAFPGCRPLTFLLDVLHRGLSSDDHTFWGDDITMLDVTLFDRRHIVGHRQITDTYLLGLAVRNGGRLVTFDQAIRTDAVHGATAENLVRLSA
jgi:toxin-antitoxin system PIN domain toxin